jgi:hypothetical protein
VLAPRVSRVRRRRRLGRCITVRIGLFARSFRGERVVQRSAVALVGIGTVRGAAVALLVAGAAACGLAPRWLLLAPAVPAVAALLAHRRVNAVLTHLRVRDCGALFGWATLAAACRCASIGAPLVAVGVLAPGLAGVGGAAFAGGVSFYVGEAAAGAAFGIVVTAAFVIGRADRDVPVPVW